MGFLSQHASAILENAGYPANHPARDNALACAEELITRHTNIVFGSSASATVTVRLSVASMILPLPVDVTAVASVMFEGQTLEAVYGVGTTTEQDRFGLRLVRENADQVWRAGRYVLNVTRGIATVPQDVVKAASLIVAWFLGLSDPDRSRYTNLAIGDMAGDMRLMELPVPEAQSLLVRWRNRVAVGA